MSTHCKWCLCKLKNYARPGGECANCWEIRKRCENSPKVGLLIAISIGQDCLARMIKEASTAKNSVGRGANE